jgi:hypothetical protein
MTSNWNQFLSFFWLSRFASWCNMNIWCHDNNGPIRPRQKKKLTKYIWRTCSRWWIALIPLVNANGLTYVIVVSVPVENTTYIYNHTSSLIPQVALMRLMQHRQHCICYENVFTSCRRRPQNIPMSPHPRCTVVASRTIDAQSLPHDMDCPQVSLIIGASL